MSSSLSSNRYVNKLQVNRLKAQEIKSDNVLPQSISWLFSAVFTTATFNRDSTGGVLVFNKSDVSSVIQFSDRPFRKTMDITVSEFVSYFTLIGSNSFEKDPPNVVLNHNEEQRTYTMSLASEDSDKVSFNLVLLPGESHNLSTVSGLMNLFVDDLLTKFDDLLTKIDALFSSHPTLDKIGTYYTTTMIIEDGRSKD